MRTSKPISTICYLTPEQLEQRLLRLVAEYGDVVSQAFFVPHLPESDKTKSHIHLLLVPNCTLDTDALWFRELWFTEYAGETVSSVMPWKSSKLEDAVLYFAHNERYLNKHGLKRKYHYSESDFYTTDESWFSEIWSDAVSSSASCIDKMLDCVSQGLNVFQAMSACCISYGAMKAFHETYLVLCHYQEALEEGGES